MRDLRRDMCLILSVYNLQLGFAAWIRIPAGLILMFVGWIQKKELDSVRWCMIMLDYVRSPSFSWFNDFFEGQILIID